MNNKAKIILYIFLVCMLAGLLFWIIKLELEQRFWVVFIAGFIVSPFMIVLYLSLFREKNKKFKPKIGGLPTKDFMTAWIAFWGLVGIAGGIIQVQRQITIQKEQFSDQQQLQRDQFSDQIANSQKQFSDQIANSQKQFSDQQKEQRDQFNTQISNQEKQQQEQRYQFEAQFNNQQKQLRETRFASGVELLGNPNESARIGGAYILYFLASENPEYVDAVCEILCAHVRTKTNEKDYRKDYEMKPSYEIQTILDLLFKEQIKHGMIFSKCREKNLERTFLSGVNFEWATLSYVNFIDAEINNVYVRYAENMPLGYVNLNTMSHINFSNATLNNVHFYGTTFSNVNFTNTGFTDVRFVYATLSNNVHFSDATLNNVYFNATLDGNDFWNATLNDVRFNESKLSDVCFRNATLNKVYFNGRRAITTYIGKEISSVKYEIVGATLNDVDFEDAIFEQKDVDFTGTPLENVPPEKIKCYRCSRELTKPKKENK